MRLSDIKTILHAEVLWGEEHLDREVFSACGSDFMSDVLAFVKNQALLLTGLVNPQVVRTADMVEMKCIVFVRGKVPGPDILSLAEERDIVVMKMCIRDSRCSRRGGRTPAAPHSRYPYSRTGTATGHTCRSPVSGQSSPRRMESQW